MNAAHLHLLLNHFPIVGVLFAGALLVWGLVKKEQLLLTVAKVTTIAVAIATVATYLTGEPAEEVVEHMAGFNKDLLHAHEAAALFALIFGIAAGVVALVTLFKGKQKRWPHFVLGLQLLHLFAVMAQVGNLGGQIQHAELRDTAAAAAAATLNSPEH